MWVVNATRFGLGDPWTGACEPEASGAALDSTMAEVDGLGVAPHAAGAAASATTARSRNERVARRGPTAGSPIGAAVPEVRAPTGDTAPADAGFTPAIRPRRALARYRARSPCAMLAAWMGSPSF